MFGIPRQILGSAAAQPQQAAGQEVADLAEVGREMDVRGWRWHGCGTRSYRSTKKNSENSCL
jgi:hypothetical protein